jgi:hypothetical protein
LEKLTVRLVMVSVVVLPLRVEHRDDTCNAEPKVTVTGSPARGVARLVGDHQALGPGRDVVFGVPRGLGVVPDEVTATL